MEAKFKIECNFELPSYLGKNKLYENIIAQQNKARKVPAFMDCLSKFTVEKEKI